MLPGKPNGLDHQPAVASSAEGLRAATSDELRARSQARQGGQAILVYRGPGGDQRVVVLDPDAERLTIGRRPDNAIPLTFDPNTSRVHAQLDRLGGEWVIVDDGLSRNGSSVNGRRLAGRHRLADGDVITVGLTPLLFRAPLDPVGSTAAGGMDAEVPRLTDMQWRVLISLCRPCRDPDQLHAPATNIEIAGEVFLSVDAVKTHLRVLFTKFRVGDLPKNQKRLRLVAEALRTGAVGPHDLG